MNLNVTTNVKNRINRINDYNPADTARNAASATKDKAVELATGLPKRALEIFQQAFQDALAAMAEYGAITAHAFKSGYTHIEAAHRHHVDALQADDLETALEAAQEARPHLFHGTVDLLIADGLAVPVTSAWMAGAKIMTGSLTLAAVADLAIPVIFTIAVGYAALKIREMSRERLHDLVEDALDSVRDVTPEELSNLNGNAKIVTAEDEDALDDLDLDLDRIIEDAEDDTVATDGGSDAPFYCDDCNEGYDDSLSYTHHITVEHDEMEESA